MGCFAVLQVTPSWGWILVYEYMFMFMFIFYGKFLHFCAVAGKQPGITHHIPNKVRFYPIAKWHQAAYQGILFFSLAMYFGNMRYVS